MLGSLLSPAPMRRDRAGLTTWDISCPAKVDYDLLQPLCAYLLTSVLPATLLCCSYRPDQNSDTYYYAMCDVVKFTRHIDKI